MSEYDSICDTLEFNGRASREAEYILDCLEVELAMHGVVSILTSENRDAFMRALSFSLFGDATCEQMVLSLKNHAVKFRLRSVSEMAAEVKKKDPASSIADRIFAVLNDIEEKILCSHHRELLSE